MIAARTAAARRTMSTDCIVHVVQGALKGQPKVSSVFSKKKFYAFQGIPYAKPPVGPLRFKDPQPCESWSGVRDALSEPEICPQKHIILREVLGNEDCLYLNVYTPQLPNEASTLKAVMVWLHGGGFSFGSGNTDLHGPDYLMEQDVVLVTLNYRVGAFGFLSLENNDVPGNAGLKDQLMALRWVQQNIARFGGDPNNVTLFGESAGGASVHYHLLSPLSKGLFKRAIIQSASCTNHWALSLNAKERTFRLGEILGLKTENPGELLKFLQQVPSLDIVNSQFKTLTSVDKRNVLAFPFVPSIEVPGTGHNFLIIHPKTALHQGHFAHIPIMIGVTSKEGMVLLNDIPHTTEYFKVLDTNFERIVPLNIGLPNDRMEKIVEKLKHLYFGDKSISWETLTHYIDFFGDILFHLGVNETVKAHAKLSKAPLYCYEFTYEGNLGMLKNFLKMKYPEGTDLSGVAHADDLGYIFKQNIPGLPTLEPGSEDEKIITRVTKMWTEFAKTGNPNAPGLGVKWESVSKSKLCYLDIGKSMKMVNGLPHSKRVEFWEELLHPTLKEKL